MTYEITSVDDNTIGQMLSNPDILAISPAIKIAADQLAELNGCQRCQAAKQQQRTQIMNTLKLSIRMMSGQPLLRLKQLLGTKKLRLRTFEGGKLIDWTL